MTRTTETGTAGTALPAIERQVTIRADRQRVWELISEPGWWINEGALTEHTIEERDGLVHVTDAKFGTFALEVVELRAPEFAAFRWAPWASPETAAPGTPSTLIEFTLREVEGSVVLSVRESGWEGAGLDRERLAENHQENVEGWELELELARAGLEGATPAATA